MLKNWPLFYRSCIFLLYALNQLKKDEMSSPKSERIIYKHGWQGQKFTCFVPDISWHLNINSKSKTLLPIISTYKLFVSLFHIFDNFYAL